MTRVTQKKLVVRDDIFISLMAMPQINLCSHQRNEN